MPVCRKSEEKPIIIIPILWELKSPNTIVIYKRTNCMQLCFPFNIIYFRGIIDIASKKDPTSSALPYKCNAAKYHFWAVLIHFEKESRRNPNHTQLLFLVPRRRRKLSSASTAHPTLMSQLESIAESSHVGVRALHHFKCVWYHSHRPRVNFGKVTSFETQMEVPRMLRV